METVTLLRCAGCNRAYTEQDIIRRGGCKCGSRKLTSCTSLSLIDKISLLIRYMRIYL